jgi:hypothetical protein
MFTARTPFAKQARANQFFKPRIATAAVQTAVAFHLARRSAQTSAVLAVRDAVAHRNGLVQKSAIVTRSNIRHATAVVRLAVV